MKLKLIISTLVLIWCFGGSGAPSAAGQDTAEALVRRAKDAIAAIQPDEAIVFATQAIALDPRLGAAYRYRGQAYLSKFEGEARQRYFDPFARGTKTKTAENALIDLAKALEIDPRDAFAIAFRGGLNLLLNDLEAAMADYKSASLIMPEQPWFANMHDMTRKRLASQYSMAASDKRSSAGRQGDAVWKEKMRRESLALFDRSIELDASNADAFSGRAYAYEELGDLEKAAKDLSELLRLQPEDHLNYYRRGVLNSALKRYDDAVADHRKGLEILEKKSGDIELPQNDLRTEIGKNLALAGKFDEAFAMFDLALSGPRPSYITYYERGMAHLLKGNAANAEADFRKAVELGRGYRKAADELRKMGKTP